MQFIKYIKVFLLKKKTRFYAFLSAVKFYTYNSFITNFPNHKLRIFYLARVLRIRTGKNTSVNMGCFFTGNNISFGENSVANRNCYFDSRIGQILIGNNVSLSPEVYILTMTHSVNSPSFEAYSKNVVIEDYVWIGARAMIMPGVTVGYGGVLGAMSIATKSIDPYSINVVIAAKKVSSRSKELKYIINYFPFFNTDIT